MLKQSPKNFAKFNKFANNLTEFVGLTNNFYEVLEAANNFTEFVGLVNNFWKVHNN